MSVEIECTQFDLRYESYRMRNATIEKRLFVSIENQGIHTPLAGVYSSSNRSIFILLDGFKRYRSGRKLGIKQFPVDTAGNDLVPGVLAVLRSDSHSPLTALEQASFLHELHTNYAMSCKEIAQRMERSISWVSMRINLLDTMDTDIREKILRGEFPLRSYMYTLPRFTRVKNNRDEVKQFVNLTSNKGYSTRDIQTLSHAFFGEDAKVKEQLLSGNTDWTLRMLKKDPCPSPQASSEEKLYHALKSCRWHTAEILRRYRSGPDLFVRSRNAPVFELVVENCKQILKLTERR